MSTRTISLFVFLLFSQILFSQKTHSITGVLQDENEAPLVAATVVLMNKIDSSFANYGLSTDNGKFKLTGEANKEYQLQISYVGYAAFIKDITLDKDYDLGTVVLTEATNMLEAAQIEAEHIPIRMNGDTLEFNSAAFNVEAHDDVEKLLEQMPGVEIEEDGTVKINGKKVEKILVDGKEFFGEDVKAALKNLPADAIKKVEVFDKKTDQEELTGTDDENESKTINLTLKEDKKVGYMGNIEGGYGYYPDNHYYQGKLGINYFNPKMRISIIGASNNVNKAGFSYQDFQGMTGGYDNFMSGYSGMSIGNSWNDPVLSLLWGNTSGETRAITGGFNVNFFISEKTELSAHYMYTNANKSMLTKTFRRSIAPENFYTTNSQNSQFLLAQRHVFNTKFSHKFDSTQEIRLRLKMKYTDSDEDNDRYSETLGGTDSLENDINQNSRKDEVGMGLISNLHYQKKLPKKGRSLWANVAIALANNGDIFDNFSQTRLYQNQQITTIDTLNQNQTSANDKQVYGAEFAYTEPLGDKNHFEFKLRAGFSVENNDRKAYDIKEQVEVLNSALTDLYQKEYNFQAFTTDFKHQGEKVSVKLSAGIQRSGLKGILASSATVINQTYYYPVGHANFKYKFTKSKSLNLNYRTNVQEPNLNQLQPMLNNQNPLSIGLGNPNLIPEYRHNVWLSYNLWDQLTFTSLYVSLYGNLTQNAITSKQTIDDNFRRTYQPVNFGTSSNFGFHFGYNGEIKKIIKYNIRGGAGLGQQPILLNEEASEQLNHNYNLYASFGNKKKKIVDLSISARANLNNSYYSQNDALNVTSLTHSYNAKVRVTIAKKWQLKTNFEYTIFDDLGYGESFAIPIWSASVGRTFFKGDQLKIELSAENILNEAFRINRYNWGANITETQTNLLGRYFMLSVSYKINKMGGNQPSPAGGGLILLE
ncbi:outer membrane beta-barrel family protein [Aureispira sp. CCB-E]|uniref:outer membrane beta-barrel family protein n=1 Tax=Aureispira sp. CCB-E TaxID=3051121 RepID=UPI0028697A6E|nr:outer membrane beta-barrel family protein [Aureispira sp. CCB-E]WMX15135.1 outer membrane beta-barrel family protein [Aureispira sp. CCB-E]